MLKADLNIKELERKIETDLKFQYIQNIVKHQGCIVFNIKKITISYLFKLLFLFQMTNQYQIKHI